MSAIAGAERLPKVKSLKLENEFRFLTIPSYHLLTLRVHISCQLRLSILLIQDAGLPSGILMSVPNILPMFPSIILEPSGHHSRPWSVPSGKAATNVPKLVLQKILFALWAMFTFSLWFLSLSELLIELAQELYVISSKVQIGKLASGRNSWWPSGLNLFMSVSMQLPKSGLRRN